MRVLNENVYRELAKLAKKSATRLIYARNHAKWHMQGRKVWS